MKIAYQQTDTFSNRLKAIDLLAQYASPPVAAFAGKIATELRKDLALFEQPDPSCVYQLCVEAIYSDWNKNYICNTLSAAKRVIQYVLDHEFEPSEIRGYTIRKRKLLTDTFPVKMMVPPDPDDPEDEPSEEWENVEIGYCKYAPGDISHPEEIILLSVEMEQARYYLYDDDDYCAFRGVTCLDCDYDCFEGDMQFPNILKPGDIVRYRYEGCSTNYFHEEDSNYRYGIHILWYVPKESEKLVEYYYILPLDKDLYKELKEVGFEDLIQHEHVSAPNIEKILTIEELPESLQEGCRACLEAYKKYLENTNSK